MQLFCGKKSYCVILSLRNIPSMQHITYFTAFAHLREKHAKTNARKLTIDWAGFNVSSNTI